MNDDHHHHTRELERQIERMNRRMEEKRREMERSLATMHRKFEDPTRRPEPPGRLPAEEELSGGPESEVQSPHPPELGPVGEGASRLPAGPGTMNIDLIDQGEELVLTAAVPGFSKDEIEVSLVDDVLHIEASQEESEEEEDEGQYLKRERRRLMSRSVALGSPIAEDEEISARYKNGVVTIRLPKAEPAEDESARQIDLE